MDNTFDLLELNQKYRMQIIAHRNQAINLESAIGENEKKIWKLCKHEWERDITCGQDSLLRSRCSKCMLWNHSFMYQ